ncbi:MAG: tRNA pseudouridine(65) synthase TruC [Gammaproteobacteria bacterium]|nr:MAG: tRNA pseudouridine(65) synthase TruC [Gammaproteobacteria bacterium]
MLDILYHDEHLVAINKPSGLLVHRSLIDARAQAFAVQLTRDRIGQRVYPVHRLDRATSGVLLFALSGELASQVSEQFVQRVVRKTYLALVRGHTDSEGRIDYPLKERLDRLADGLADRNKPAQAAITDYCAIEKRELPHPVGRYQTARYTLVSLSPHTGRKHQLRRHMKHIFHPIVGDTTYGDGRHNTFVREQFHCHRLMLHAAGLCLRHPVSKAMLELQAPLPSDMREPLRQMGFSIPAEVTTSATDTTRPIGATNTTDTTGATDTSATPSDNAGPA